MKALLLTLLFASAACPATLSILNPNLSASAGNSADWQFQVTPSDSLFYTYVSSFLVDETNPSIGVYSDNIGLLGGPQDFVLPPSFGTWSGIAGTYTLDPAATVGALNLATLRVLYESYTDDPLTCGNCFAGSDFRDFAVSVTVAPVPEPGSIWLMVAGGAGILLRRVARKAK
jgi:hypothetical protein